MVKHGDASSFCSDDPIAGSRIIKLVDIVNPKNVQKAMTYSPLWSPFLVGSILLFLVWALDPHRSRIPPDPWRLVVASPGIAFIVWVVGFTASQFFLLLWHLHVDMKADFLSWIMETLRLLF